MTTFKLIWHALTYIVAIGGLGIATVLVIDQFVGHKTPPKVRITPPDWRLTDDEIRAKELRLVAGRDARRHR